MMTKSIDAALCDVADALGRTLSTAVRRRIVRHQSRARSLVRVHVPRVRISVRRTTHRDAR